MTSKVQDMRSELIVRHDSLISRLISKAESFCNEYITRVELVKAVLHATLVIITLWTRNYVW